MIDIIKYIDELKKCKAVLISLGCNIEGKETYVYDISDIKGEIQKIMIGDVEVKLN